MSFLSGYENTKINVFFFKEGARDAREWWPSLVEVIYYFLLYFLSNYCWCVVERVLRNLCEHGNRTARATYYEFKNTQLTSRMIFSHVISLLVQHMYLPSGQRLANGLLNFPPFFLSCLRKHTWAPLFIVTFHFSPCFFDCFVWSLFLLYSFWFVSMWAFNWNCFIYCSLISVLGLLTSRLV